MVQFRKILNDPAISVKRRLHIAQAYIYSKGLYLSCTWPHLTQALYERFSNAVISVYRKITANGFGLCDKNLMLSDSELLFEYSLASPRSILVSQRLSLFGRIVSKNVESLLKLFRLNAGVKNGWVHAVLDNIEWVSFANGNTPNEGMTVNDLIVSIRGDYSSFRKGLRKACKSKLASLHSCDYPSDAKPSLGMIEYITCGLLFPSAQQLALHMFKAHGVKSILRRYVCTTHCTVCMKEFHTRERHLNHLRYRSQICKLSLLLHPPLICEEEAVEADSVQCDVNCTLQKQGKRRHHAASPCVQLCGPLQYIPVDPSTASNHHPLGRGHNYFDSKGSRS